MILIDQEIEFHNAAALEPLAGIPGLSPVRFPAKLRETLNHGARLNSTTATGVELRFVTAAPSLRLALAAGTDNVTVHIYRGEIGHSDHTIPAGQTRLLHLTVPEHFANVTREPLEAGAFSPDVWRAQVSGGSVGFLGLETFGHAVRPPAEHEKPSRRWLAYGSSITQSWAKGYPHQAARRLGVDVLNKGLSGSCHCEESLAKHLANEESWDFATLELGVNMRGIFTPEVFGERARTLVAHLRSAKPEAPLILITHFHNREHYALPSGPNLRAADRQLAFDAILRAIAAERAAEPTCLLEGSEILSSLNGLSCDLLHPSDFGHIEMGENLANALRRILES